MSAAMAEWLRRWTRNPMGYSRAGSNPVRSENLLLEHKTFSVSIECFGQRLNLC